MSEQSPSSELRQLADLLDGLMNTFASGQTVQDVKARALMRQGALTNVLDHPATRAVAAWMDAETARGDNTVARCAHLLESVVNHAKDITAADNAAAKTRLVLPATDTQGDLAKLLAFATTVIRTLRLLAEQQGQSAADGQGPGHVKTLALDDEDERILRALGVVAPRLLTIEEIEEASRVSRKTISKRMGNLLQAGLVHRPNGPKRGATITSDGKAMLTRIAGAKSTR
jgi:hypothetical protein